MKVILLKEVENIVAKGEIVLSNFFLGHDVFKKLSAAEASESVCIWERVNIDRWEKIIWQPGGMCGLTMGPFVSMIIPSPKKTHLFMYL